MMSRNDLLFSTFSSIQLVRKLRKTISLALHQRHLYGKTRRYNTGKELDTETGLYYFGARYLDPKASRWISGDPALGEYLPSAPVNEEARKRNGNLPGMGGVFNYVNLHVYHYGGNNPVKYTDPDGRNIVVAENQSIQFKNNFNIAMNYLERSPTASIIIHHVKNEMDVSVVYTPSSSGYLPLTSTIYWDDRQGLLPNRGGVISSARVLMHEITHAFLRTELGEQIFVRWKEDLEALNPQGIPSNYNYEDEFVTYIEGIIGDQLGEKAKRRYYNDVARDAEGNMIMTTVPNPTFYRDPPVNNNDEQR